MAAEPAPVVNLMDSWGRPSEARQDDGEPEAGKEEEVVVAGSHVNANGHAC